MLAGPVRGIPVDDDAHLDLPSKCATNAKNVIFSAENILSPMSTKPKDEYYRTYTELQ